MKLFPIKKILILVTILAVPGFLYYLLQEKGKNRYKPLAIYGPKQVAKTFHSVRGKAVPDTIYHTIPNFDLLNQDSTSVNLQSYRGKIMLMNLFYTNGKNRGVAFANKAMEGFSKVYEKNALMRFVGVSIDEVYDRPSVLAGYAKQLEAKAGKWDLLTGDSSQTRRLITKGLLLDAIKTEDNGQLKFVFSNMFVLVDSKHRVRGYYDATNQEALSKLDDEIKVLIAEELRNMRDGR